MPDFLTRRNGTWHFVRRVPAEFAAVDPRVIIRHSTKIRVTTDRTGRRAIRVVEQLNAALQAQWLDLAGRKTDAAAQSYRWLGSGRQSMGRAAGRNRRHSLIYMLIGRASVSG